MGNLLDTWAAWRRAHHRTAAETVQALDAKRPARRRGVRSPDLYPPGRVRGGQGAAWWRRRHAGRRGLGGGRRSGSRPSSAPGDAPDRAGGPILRRTFARRDRESGAPTHRSGTTRASGRAAGSTRRRRFGYHALAIDEQRRDFEPCPWDEADAAEGQTIEQVWFAGVHSDVGGWYDERGLSNVALHWMLGKAGDCGLRVDRAGLASRRPDPHGTMHQSWAGIWKTRPCRTRKVSEGARVHRSVFERRDGGRVRYDPKNLPANPTVVD